MKLAVFTLLSLSGASLAAPAATTQVVFHPNGNTTKCLGAASNTDGAAVIVQDCSGGATGSSASQLWTISSGTLQIFGDKCLDDTNGIQTNGEKMQIWTCASGNTNQKWAPTRYGGIGLAGTNKCLDDTDGKLTSGSAVQIWDCNGDANQGWALSPAGPPPPTQGKQIQPGPASSECLTAASNTDNAAVTIEKCDGSASQAWNVTGGTVQIFGNKCLDVTNGSTTNGVKMQIYTCFAGNTNQQFTVTGDNRIAWTNMHECLDLTDGNVNSGTAVQMWHCTDNDNNQVWNIV